MCRLWKKVVISNLLKYNILPKTCNRTERKNNAFKHAQDRVGFYRKGKAICQISKNHLERYKTLFKVRFGKDLDDKTASEQLTKLVNLMRLIDKPITKAEFERLQKRRKELDITISNGREINGT